jgi:hypothetical protein
MVDKKITDKPQPYGIEAQTGLKYLFLRADDSYKQARRAEIGRLLDKLITPADLKAEFDEFDRAIEATRRRPMPRWLLDTTMGSRSAVDLGAPGRTLRE